MISVAERVSRFVSRMTPSVSVWHGLMLFFVCGGGASVSGYVYLVEVRSILDAW